MQVGRRVRRDGDDAAAFVDGLEVEGGEGPLTLVEIVPDPQQIDGRQQEDEAQRGPEDDENEPEGAARRALARAPGQSVRSGLRPG